ncbi:MAG TPA: nitroreductase family deazaflavin-dependent oxidoreductase [Actinomycetota bacterium]|nr:nitroreductase family deazaflavin-dependent oxidoreductase [Actinomycetota bacterium]
MSDRNQGIIDEFRANHGTVGGYFEGRTLLLLTHRGATSGTVRTNPLAYRREGDRIFIFGSKGGAPSHPDWFRNIVANPDVTVEIGDDRFPATAVQVTGAERDEIYDRQGQDWPAFAGYQRELERTIPVIELVPTADGRSSEGSG